LVPREGREARKREKTYGAQTRRTRRVVEKEERKSEKRIVIKRNEEIKYQNRRDHG